MGINKVDKGLWQWDGSRVFEGCSSTVIIAQERGNMYEDACLFSTCTSYSQSYDDDVELSDS